MDCQSAAPGPAIVILHILTESDTGTKQSWSILVRRVHCHCRAAFGDSGLRNVGIEQAGRATRVYPICTATTGTARTDYSTSTDKHLNKTHGA